MNKPTFFFINVGGDWLSVAQRIKEEGYKTYYYKQKGMVKGREDTGVGIFSKTEIIDDKFEILNKFKNNKEDLIILVDDNGYGNEFDYLRSEGWKVIGGTDWGDQAEYQRSLGLDIMQSIGLDLPYEKNFTKIDDAISWLEEEDPDCRYVFKPEGEDFAGSSKTYTSKNKQDLIDYLKWIKADCVEKHYDVAKFVLQEFVDGIEADFAGYFNGQEFVKGVCLLDVEEKKSGDGNKGEATGCMGNVIINFHNSRYFDEYLAKLTKVLREKNYVGEISINNIFAKGSKGKHKEYKAGMPYGLEFTPRFGWDAHLTEMALVKASGQTIASFYMALANKTPFNFPDKTVGTAVRVYTGSISLAKSEVAGRYMSFPKELKNNIWFYSASIKDGAYIIEDNPVCLAQAVTTDLTKGIKRVYDGVLKQLNVPDAYYRTEIGQRAFDVIRFLKKYNWI